MNSMSASRSKLQPVDPIWAAIRAEAEEAVTRDPLLSAFLYSTILNHDNLEDVVIHRLAERLDHQDLSADLIRQTFTEMLRDNRQNACSVAYSVGFNSEAAFNRAFKREFGAPPATWAREAVAA